MAGSKESAARARVAQALRLESFDQRVVSFDWGRGDSGFGKLLGLMGELRAIYNSVLVVQRESYSHNLWRWCLEKAKESSGKERKVYLRAARKWLNTTREHGFARCRELGLEDYAKENWLSNPMFADSLVKKIREARLKQGLGLEVFWHSKIVQNSVAKRLNEAWKAFRDPKREVGMPTPMNSRYLTLDLNNQVLKIKKGLIWIGSINTEIKLWSEVDPSLVQAATVRTYGDDLRINLVYNVPKNTGEAPRWLTERPTMPGVISAIRAEHANVPLVAGIDLGIANLLTVAFNHTYLTPLSYDGAYSKSVNQGAHKTTSKLRSQGRGESHAEKKVWGLRNKRVEHEFKSIATDLVSRLFYMGTTKLIIGWNPGFKDNFKMGRRWNQVFGSLPLAKLRDEIASRASIVGIEVEVCEESYTSKASFLDNDPIPVYDANKQVKHKFSGSRVKRGLYKSNISGAIIHSDVQGALNILRKSSQHLVLSSGIVVMPRGVTPIWRPQSPNRQLITP